LIFAFVIAIVFSSNNKSIFVCQNCGYESLKWLGRCPSCQEWNTLVETLRKEETRKGGKGIATEMVSLENVSLEGKEKKPIGFEELDRVLGGGLVAGGVVLLAGEPGIGKSTLLLQVAQKITQNGERVVYICGEESPSQIKLRANRLNVLGKNLMLLPETDVDAVVQSLERENLALQLLIQSKQ